MHCPPGAVLCNLLTRPKLPALSRIIAGGSLTLIHMVNYCCFLCCCDRGFHVCYIREDTAIPEQVDLKTGSVRYSLRPCHKFRISFDARGPRDEMKVREDHSERRRGNSVGETCMSHVLTILLFEELIQQS
jgi:hypothetical protein